MNNNNLAKQNYINSLLNNYFNLFVVIFVSFLLLMSYFLLLKPKVDMTTAAISENISSHEKLLQAEKIKLSNLQEAVLAYNNIDKVDLARVNGILPNEYNKEALYGEIEEVIKQNGFIPTSIVLSKDGESGVNATAQTNDPSAVVKPVTNIGTVHISLTVDSVNYASLKNLLTVLESNLRLLDVKSLSLNDGHSAALELDTYYYKK